MKLFLLIILVLTLFFYLGNQKTEKFSNHVNPEEPEEPEESINGGSNKTIILAEHPEIPEPESLKKPEKKPCIQQNIGNYCPEYHISVHNIKGTTSVTTPKLNFSM